MKESKSLFNRQVTVPAVEPVKSEGKFILDNYDFHYFADETRNKVYQLSHNNPEFFCYREEITFREHDKFHTVDGRYFRDQLQAHIEFCQKLLEDVEAVIAVEDTKKGEE